MLGTEPPLARQAVILVFAAMTTVPPRGCVELCAAILSIWLGLALTFGLCCGPLVLRQWDEVLVNRTPVPLRISSVQHPPGRILPSKDSGEMRVLTPSGERTAFLADNDQGGATGFLVEPPTGAALWAPIDSLTELDDSLIWELRDLTALRAAPPEIAALLDSRPAGTYWRWLRIGLAGAPLLWLWLWYRRHRVARRVPEEGAAGS